MINIQFVMYIFMLYLYEIKSWKVVNVLPQKW